MREDIAVEVAGVTKTYRLRKSGSSPAQTFDALRDVSLSVRRGERLGIVGRNGAGKTTLLKLIIGNLSPTRGRVEVRGQVQALMQVGLGFHPEFTGRENARSALLYNGLSGSTIERALADVIEFTELGEFLDQPMSTYSLGMRMRLQFAAATAIEPDILIVDEVMGAGDAYFSAKSADRMKRLTASGCTLLLVSHSPYQVLEFCGRAVWLDGGRVRMEGDAHEVLGAYEVHLEQLTAASGGAPGDEASGSALLRSVLDDGRPVFRWPGKTGLKVATTRLTDGDIEVDQVRPGGPLILEIVVRAERGGCYSCKYLVTLWSERMRRVARVEGVDENLVLQAGAARRVVADLSPFLLSYGRYYLSISLYDTSAGVESGTETRFDVLARCLTLDVRSDARVRGPLFSHPARWAFST